ncbi:hypothetical protein O181_029899 [Austropuccinia psidii MF-1]|uniref:Uncharacterized protein n=1 Tax=Austropuccinia psidii MF-1 TaxID=1389203 RepID=A0A9Q3CRS5_9BASI|nr:hypothetical protein [Austropuccinia psidii MF-1]
MNQDKDNQSQEAEILTFRAQNVIHMWLQQNQPSTPSFSPTSSLASSFHSTNPPWLELSPLLDECKRHLSPSLLHQLTHVDLKLNDTYNLSDSVAITRNLSAKLHEPTSASALGLAIPSNGLQNPQNFKALNSFEKNKTEIEKSDSPKTQNISALDSQSWPKISSKHIESTQKRIEIPISKPVLPNYEENPTSGKFPSEHWYFQIQSMRSGDKVFDLLKDRKEVKESEDGLMGFNPDIQSMMSEAWMHMCPVLPWPHDSLITIADYSACNSRSPEFVKLIVNSIFKAFSNKECAFQLPPTIESKSFICVIHSDKPHMEYGYIQKLSQSTILEKSSSHVSTQKIFPLIATNQVDSLSCPPNSVSVGFSLLTVHQVKTHRLPEVDPQSHGLAELKSFLATRAKEFRQDGVLLLGFVIGKPPDPVEGNPFSFSAPYATNTWKTTSKANFGSTIHQTKKINIEVGESKDSPAAQDNLDPNQLENTLKPQRPHIWFFIFRLITNALQYLVSQGSIPPILASKARRLPVHTFYAEDVQKVLIDLQDEWALEYSCGLGTEEEITSLYNKNYEEGEMCQTDASIQNTTHLGNSPNLSPSILPGLSTFSKLSNQVDSTNLTYPKMVAKGPLLVHHPAQVKFHERKISRKEWNAHVVNFLRLCYEQHLQEIFKVDGENFKKTESFSVENSIEALWVEIEHRLSLDSYVAKEFENLFLEVAVIGLRKK